MGCFGSKDKLSKEDMDFLKSHTRYDEATIKEWYKGFKQDCPNGRLTPAKFVDMYKMFFPSGNAEEFCDHVFRTFDMDKNGYIDFKVRVLCFLFSVRPFPAGPVVRYEAKRSPPADRFRNRQPSWNRLPYSSRNVIPDRSTFLFPGPLLTQQKGEITSPDPFYCFSVKCGPRAPLPFPDARERTSAGNGNRRTIAASDVSDLYVCVTPPSNYQNSLPDGCGGVRIPSCLKVRYRNPRSFPSNGSASPSEPLTASKGLFISCGTAYVFDVYTPTLPVPAEEPDTVM
ncbi:UNVERIFIED_CONTAM: hypothetical protein PYX00_001354 [Menopon gallinae]|uniref:EF-hand domain-containing protein n=1 Tax=Menopon gallinae TaxID=328185 RepID=A0AAW2ID60_9NEOP